MDKSKFKHDVGGDWVTDLMVMKSGAGYYIGRAYWDEEFGFEGPYSRESGYYATEAEAQAELDSGEFLVRDCIENQWAYQNGLPHPSTQYDLGKVPGRMANGACPPMNTYFDEDEEAS